MSQCSAVVLTTASAGRSSPSAAVQPGSRRSSPAKRSPRRARPRGPGQREQQRVGVDADHRGPGDPVQQPHAERAGPAADVEHQRVVPARPLGDRVDQRGETLLPVGHVSLLLRVPAADPGRGLARAQYRRVRLHPRLSFPAFPAPASLRGRGQRRTAPVTSHASPRARSTSVTNLASTRGCRPATARPGRRAARAPAGPRAGTPPASRPRPGQVVLVARADQHPVEHEDHAGDRCCSAATTSTASSSPRTCGVTANSPGSSGRVSSRSRQKPAPYTAPQPIMRLVAARAPATSPAPRQRPVIAWPAIAIASSANVSRIRSGMRSGAPRSPRCPAARPRPWSPRAPPAGPACAR